MKKYLTLLIIALTPLAIQAQNYTADAVRFLSTVYQNHPTLVSERLKLQQNQLSITEAEGLHDPLITGRVTRQKDAATYFSQTGQIISKETTTTQADISQKLASGADIGIGVQSTQQDNNGTIYSSRLSINANQPLLNGFGELPTDINIMTAKLTADKSKIDYNSSVASTLQSALKTYSQYVIAWQKETIYEDDIFLSRYLLAQIKLKNSLDMSDEIALLDAEIQVATVQDAQRSTSYERKSLEAALKTMTGETWQPTASENIKGPDSPQLQTAITTALAQNPGLIAMAFAIAKQTLTVKLRENKSLPVLDLNGALGYNKSGNDWQQSLQFQDPSFAIGISTSFPWGNKEANAQLEYERLALKDLKNQQQQLQISITEQVKEAYNDVSLKKDRLQHHQNILTLATKKLILEKKKFELGMSLVDTLLEAQKYKTNAAIASGSAEFDYLQACLLRDSLLGNLSWWVSL